MADAPNDSTEAASQNAERSMTLEEREALYKAEMESAGQAFVASWLAYLEAVRKHHGLTQWRDGFDVGWKSSREYFREEFKKSFEHEAKSSGVAGPSGVGMLAGLAPFLEPNMLTTAPPASPIPTTPTANQLVHQFVAENPGKRGVEIADNFAKTVWRLPERTVRTALHRLKKAEKIKVVDGRWYAAERAPVDPQLSLKE